MSKAQVKAGSASANELRSLLTKARKLGFDESRRRPDGTTFANLGGQAKYAILRNFLRNFEKKAGKGPADAGPSKPVFERAKVERVSNFEWTYVGSGDTPEYTALKCSVSDVAYSFPELVNDVMVSKLHLLVKARPRSEATSPLASVTAIDKAGDTELTKLALNSRFAVKKLFPDQESIGYRVTLTKPVRYADVREKIRFIVSTANFSAENWLFVQPWALLRKDHQTPVWEDNSYIDVVYNVDD